MATNSKIEWTNDTWNPITGCTRVSEGCRHCYAERMARRLQAMGKPGYQGTVDKNGRWTGQINFIESALEIPLKRKKSTVYFVNSMSDLFHADIKFDWLDAIWSVMARCPQHTFQILTKRAGLLPERVKAMVDAYGILPNVQIGVSVENQAAADERIPYLIRTPAAIRFLSCEPLLGPVRALRYLIYGAHKWEKNIHWVIVGGESGPGARPMHPDWARDIREDCIMSGVAFFFKQWGNTLPFGQEASYDSGWVNKSYVCNDVGYICGKKAAGRLLDGQEWSQFP